ncbi:MAG TPA: hypothetical protein VKT29_05615 [Terriglobales bacterium]|nr:hypothetical protein [Terriglobales bacterium]
MQDILYTVSQTPVWASAHPQQTCGSAVTGTCVQPSDIGSGDNYWKNFVTAFMSHRAAMAYGGLIKTIEVWNEPQNKARWCRPVQDAACDATWAMLATMIRDAAAIIHTTAGVSVALPGTGLKPSSGGVDASDNLLTELENLGAQDAIDIIAMHRYDTPACPDYPSATAILTDSGSITAFKSMIAGHDRQAAKPLWFTEGSWGPTAECADWAVDLAAQRAFFAQWFIGLYGEGVSRTYWYNWDINAKLWQSDSAPVGQVLDTTDWIPDGNGGKLNWAGAAYNRLQDWLTGITFANSPHGCTAENDVWTCEIKKDGRQARFVWYDRWGSTTDYVPGAAFSGGRQTQIDGTSRVIGDGSSSISIGPEPQLLEQLPPMILRLNPGVRLGPGVRIGPLPPSPGAAGPARN